jgi:hypothetical protein
MHRPSRPGWRMTDTCERYRNGSYCAIGDSAKHYQACAHSGSTMKPQIRVCASYGSTRLEQEGGRTHQREGSTGLNPCLGSFQI